MTNLDIKDCFDFGVDFGCRGENGEFGIEGPDGVLRELEALDTGVDDTAELTKK